MRLLLLIITCAVLFTANSFAQAPVFTACPSNIVVNSPANGCATTASYNVAVTGATSPVTYTFTGATVKTSTNGTGNGSTFNRGVTTVTVSATNGSGTSRCIFTVEVKDVTAPSIACAPNVTINNTEGLCTATTALTAPTASDNCSTPKLGNAVAFDGVNDYIAMPNNFQSNFSGGKITVETWVYFNANTNWASIIKNWGNTVSGAFHFGLEGTSQKLNIQITQSNGTQVSVTAPSVISLNAWHHVAFVTDGSKLRLYQDGAEVGSANYNGTLKTTFGYITIGARRGDGGGVDNVAPGYLNGKIDELRVWRVGRTLPELLAYMYSEPGVLQPDLFTVYHFNQGTAAGSNGGVTTLTDASGYAQNGVLTNFALSGATSNWVTGKPLGLVVSNNAPATYPIGTTVVTWTAMDENGNSATCNQSVTVVSPEINIQGNGSDIADGSASPNVANHTQFDQINLGENTIRTYTIQNTGTANLTLAAGSVTLTGANASSFALSGITLPATILPGGFTTFSVTLNPNTAGEKNVVLNIASNDCNEATYDFAIKGTVVDVTPPSITCKPDTTILNRPGLCTGFTSLGIPEASDISTANFPANALDLDGVNDYVNLGTSTLFRFTNAMTVEGWVKVSSFTKTWQVIVAKGDDSWRIHRFLNTNFISFATGGPTQGDLVSTIPINDGQWHHIAAVYNGSTKFLYIDGVLNVSAPATGNINQSSWPAFIGENPQITGRTFHGKIDEMRFWNVARTGAQIKAGMLAELNAQAGLVAVYHFNQEIANGANAAKTSATDASGNNLTGTLTNFALTGTTSNWVLGLALGLNLSNNAPITYPIGVTTVTWTVADASNNTATCSQKVTVIAPNITEVRAQNNVLIADGDASPTVAKTTDFGNVGTPVMSSIKNYTISNPSDVPLVIGAITLSGANAADFSIGNLTLPDTLKPTETLSFNVNFAPQSTGVKTATVNITTNNCTLLNYDFAVKGNSVNSQTVTFNSSGTFTPMPGVTGIFVQAWGAGGNGTSVSTGNLSGGGGGAFVQSKSYPVAALTPFTVTVGTPSSPATRFGNTPDNTITANGANGQTGGAASTGAWIAFSSAGGTGGIRTTTFNTLGAGGGGGAGGTNGPGQNGGNAVSGNASTVSTIPGQGGLGGTGGGNGGKGGNYVYNGGGSAISGQTGGTPGGGGGGLFGNGANGRVIVYYLCDATPGTISNAHSVTYPPQLVPDSIISTSANIPTVQNGLVYSWQQSTDNINWVPAKTPTNGLGYRFDRDSIKVNTWYRRVSNACNTPNNFSNVVKISVVNPPNGVIKGVVRSKNGAALKGITIYAQKKGALPGSPANWLDSAVTGIDGQYTISKVYYGDPAEGTNNGFVSTDFYIWASKLNHGFKPDTLPKTLSNTDPSISSVDFTDTTVFAITGRTYQECSDCLNESNVAGTITAPLDSVEMYRDGSFVTKSGFADPPGEFGRYAVTVTDPGLYKVEPKFKNHTFNPVFTNVTVEGNVDNIDFKDVTAYTISGKLTAGCNDYIGTAVLEFSDVLPNDASGNPRASQFRKRVTTNEGSGVYSITLPARKYKVSIISFAPKPGGDVQSPDLLSFFESNIPKDSLVKDITSANATLNIVYNRPPTLDIVGLDPPCITPHPFAIFQQGVEKMFTVKVYQGPAAKNCPAVDTTLIINTNIQKDDILEVIEQKTSNGSAMVKLTGGNPNIVAPYFKALNLVYKDANGFSTQLNRDVVVTGLKSDIGSFATVSPEIPLMVLHDPPGDNSFSFWETSKTNETAMRFYSAKSNAVNPWAEVKIGAKFETGVAFGGYFSTEVAVWGSIKGSVTVGERRNNASESIVSTTTTTNFSTASNDAVVGAQGDVFIGAALNLLYAKAHEVVFNPDNCSLSLESKLSIANNGFATQYIYSEDHIRNTLIPTLKTFRDNPTNTPAQTKEYINQIKVWEQTLANNDANKKRAAFDKNLSFDGASGPISSTSTTSSSKSSTIEFDLEINTELATELGLEIGGSGVKGGVNVAFKTETGNSKTNTSMVSNTIGYTLDDDDNGDFYSVNIKKDPVYNTPVFELVAGTTSCPYEPGSQPRDEMQLIVPQPIKTDVDPNGEAEFVLKLSNTSQSGERRTYNLSFLQASNPNGAVVTIGGSQAAAPISYSIDYLGEVNVLVKVKRGASNIFSYEGLQFRLTDACDGSIEKTARISAFFTATCSPIKLVLPEGGWVNSQAENNILPVQFNGYTIANTTSVTLEYQRTGASNWVTGFTRTATELNNSVNGTLVNWNIAALNDGGYNLRMSLNCASGVVNSERASGIIDRSSPILLGKPEPTDDEFLRGDAISVQYNEALDCGGVTPSDVQVRRMSNNQLIEVNVGCFQNKIAIVPLTDISLFVGDSIRVSLNNISDLYGNGKTTTDSWRFIVGNTIPATGPRALIVGSSAPSGGIAGKAHPLSGASVPEDGGIPIKFAFELPSNAANDILINYTVSGNGIYQKDYNIDYSQPQNLATIFNGATGSLTMKKGTKKVELIIITIPNQQFEPDKTITITLAEGGDYDLGANVTATGTILNDDAPKVYIFTGSGNYNVPANWDNNLVPPGTVLTGDEVIINPADGGECILNVPVTVMPGAKFTVMPGKVLRLNNGLQVLKKL